MTPYTCFEKLHTFSNPPSGKQENSVLVNLAQQHPFMKSYPCLVAQIMEDLFFEKKHQISLNKNTN